MKKRNVIWLRLSIALALVLVIVAGATTTVKAVEFIEGDTIAADQVIEDDVFIAGNHVVIDGTVDGDLFATGSIVTLNGLVKGSMMVAAQTIEINGMVDGSIYAGSSAMSLTENAVIGRNLYYGGFGLESEAGSSVGRDLLVGAYQAQLSGEISRDLLAGLAALELNGKVGGDADVDVAGPGETVRYMPPMFSPPGAPAMIDPGLRVGPEAEIGGILKYTSPAEQTGAIEVVPGGGVVYRTPVPAETTPTPEPRVSIELEIGKWILARAREFVTLLVLGGLAIWLIPALLKRWAERVRTQPMPSAGWGLVAVLLGYAGAAALALLILAVGIFLAIVTLGGLARSFFGVGFSGLGLVFTIFNLLVSYGSKVVVAYLGGRLIVGQFSAGAVEHKVWPLLVGVTLYVLLRSIPFLGWVIGVIVTLLGLGAIWLVFSEEHQPVLPGVA